MSDPRIWRRLPSCPERGCHAIAGEACTRWSHGVAQGKVPMNRPHVSRLRRARRVAEIDPPRPLTRFERRILRELLVQQEATTGGLVDKFRLGSMAAHGARTVHGRFYDALARLKRWGLIEETHDTVIGKVWLTGKGRAAVARQKGAR